MQKKIVKVLFAELGKISDFLWKLNELLEKNINNIKKLRLGNCTFGKFPLGKWPLGKRPIGKNLTSS